MVEVGWLGSGLWVPGVCRRERAGNLCCCHPNPLDGDVYLLLPSLLNPSFLPLQIGEEGQVHVFSAKHNKWHPFKFDKVRGVQWVLRSGQLLSP